LAAVPVKADAATAVRAALAAGNGTCAAARAAGVSTSVVARIRRENAAVIPSLT
jgi:hypothetical protein